MRGVFSSRKEQAPTPRVSVFHALDIALRREIHTLLVAAKHDEDPKDDSTTTDDGPKHQHPTRSRQRKGQQVAAMARRLNKYKDQLLEQCRQVENHHENDKLEKDDCIHYHHQPDPHPQCHDSYQQPWSSKDEPRGEADENENEARWRQHIVEEYVLALHAFHSTLPSSIS
jgi:hypothetical protein